MKVRQFFLSLFCLEQQRCSSKWQNTAGEINEASSALRSASVQWAQLMGLVFNRSV